MFAERLSRILLAAARRPRGCVGVVLALALVALGWTATHFAMTTDTGELISPSTPWRVDETAVETHFPSLKDSILIVVDGATPEIAGHGADQLAAALGADKAHFVLVRRPDGGDFFAREGMLFGSVGDVKAATQRLIDAQPLLGPLAGDPSLRGIARAIDTAASGAARGDADPVASARLADPLQRMAVAIDARLQGQQTWFSWERMFQGSGGMAAPTRAMILAQPRLAFGDLQPGEAAVAVVRARAAALGIDAGHGARVSITGAVPLADEEFGTIKENIGVVGAAMVAAMLVCLWFATRSAREVLAIVLTIVAGLVMTLAAGLVLVGRFNVISVAFIPLFVGLGVDFGIQVCVRFNAELRGDGGPVPVAVDRLAALARVGRAIGEPLALAAAAIVLALGAFLPTDYTGIAELGVIAGVGMVFAFVLNVTLLPALLVLLAPGVPKRRVGWAGAAPLDRWLVRRRGWVLGAFVVAMVASVGGLRWVQFDFNPMHLRDPNAPAMAALTELTRDPDRTPDTLAVLAPNAAAAARLAARLSAVPGVARAASVDSFVPEDQAAKLALTQDAQLLLDPVLNPFDLPPAANDVEAQQALVKAAASLSTLAAARPGDLGDAAGHLASSFIHLAGASPDQRAGVETMLVAPLQVALDAVRSSLQAGPVTRDSLPPEVRDDWLAKDGSALVQVTPVVTPRGEDNAQLRAFTRAVLAVAPHATGLPVATQAAAATVSGAFVRAGVLALLLVTGLLWAVLRSLREVLFTLAPVVLSGFLTLGTCVVIGQPLNFANIIAFPLLFGVGVAFHIYFVMAWRSGVSGLLQSSLARAVVWSAMATGSAFGALWFSHHPGTASMGLILMVSLVWTLVCALIFEPALLGPVVPHARDNLGQG